MLFNSYIFILFFLPLVLLGYYGLNRIGKSEPAKIFLCMMSLWFYAYFQYSYLLIIVVSIIVNYMISRLIISEALNRNVRKSILIVGILINVGIIFYYKYFDFVMGSISWVIKEDYIARNILMPLGISFFTFQQISYLVDSWRGETKEYGIVDYVLFVSFFPQLIAGPIVFHNELIPQFKDETRKKLNHDKLAKGIWIFSIGLCKKVLIADTLGKGADYGFSNISALNGAEAFCVMLCYTLQLYFDFSGYCDMAIGIGNMFQVELPLNFNSPYKAVSIKDFWSRWHMTLTRFLRKYIYIPLGGNRKGTTRTLLNIFIVYLVSGIWHGAAWTFILWGILHGVMRIAEHIFGHVLDKIPKVLRWAGTFLLINLAWVLFRAESLSDAFLFYKQLLCGWGMPGSGALFAQFNILELTYIVEHVAVLNNFVGRYPWIYMAIILSLALVIALIPKNCYEKEFQPTVKIAMGSIILLVWAIISFSGISTFLYFNF